MATTRVKKELKDLAKSPVEGVSITPDEHDMFSWSAVLEGPSDTPYEVQQTHSRPIIKIFRVVNSTFP